MRRPFQDIPVNPFANNNNYPGLDDAFKDESKKQNKNANTTGSSPSFATTPDRASSSIISPPSDFNLLNMSIGARAAINEHTRHVAKYGLDGSLDHGYSNDSAFSLQNGHSSTLSHNYANASASASNASIINTPSRRIQYRPSPTKTNVTNSNYSNIMKDEEWDRLMDGSISHASFSSTFLVDSNKSFVSRALSSHDRRGTGGTGGGTGSHYIAHNTSHLLNLTADQSSDFFTSSRVAMLTTPEKNKPKVDEASRLARITGVGLPNDRGGVGVRGAGMKTHYSESFSGSTDVSNDIDQSGMIGLFKAAMRFGERELIEEGHHDYGNCGNIDEEDNGEEEDNPSLVSYQEPNLSLVSNTYDGGIIDLEEEDEDENCSSIQPPPSGHSFMNTTIEEITHEKPTSEFFQSSHHEYQETSFISYHETDLSIISNRLEPPDLSVIKNTEDDEPDDLSVIKTKVELEDFTKGLTQEETQYKVRREGTGFMNKGHSEFVLDGSEKCAFNQSNTLSGINQNIEQTQHEIMSKLEDTFVLATSNKILEEHSSKVEMSKKNCNLGGYINEFESQTLSDFNPIFSDIDNYEDAIHEWVEKELRSTTADRTKDDWVSSSNVRQPDHSSSGWEIKKPESEIELDYRLANLNSTLSDFPKTMAESHKRTLRHKFPSPEKSDFNVDVSAIMSASECENKFFQPNVPIARESKTTHEILRSNTKVAHQRNEKKVVSLSVMEDGGNSMNVDRNVIGLSPISGDSSSEFDNGTFKTSLPSSASSTQSKQYQGRHRNLSHSLLPQTSRDNIKEGNQSFKPHVSRLRERYSRPERFEDSYVMSYLHTSSLNHDENDKSVSRSLLQTFEYALTPE